MLVCWNSWFRSLHSQDFFPNDVDYPVLNQKYHEEATLRENGEIKKGIRETYIAGVEYIKLSQYELNEGKGKYSIKRKCCSYIEKYDLWGQRFGNGEYHQYLVKRRRSWGIFLDILENQ